MLITPAYLLSYIILTGLIIAGQKVSVNGLPYIGSMAENFGEDLCYNSGRKYITLQVVTNYFGYGRLAEILIV